MKRAHDDSDNKTTPIDLFVSCCFPPCPKDAAEVFGGDRLLAVNGIPLSSASLKEWIETSTASISITGQSSTSVGRYLHRTSIHRVLVSGLFLPSPLRYLLLSTLL